MHEKDELLDLVNSEDEVVGTVMREEHHNNVAYYNARGEYWRGTGCFLINPNQEIWIPKRQPWRNVAPGGLDFSMAEHVQSGESHIQGAVRGMKEELNIEAAEVELLLLGKRLFEGFGCIMSMYIYLTNESPDYNRDDYQDARWMTAEELGSELGGGAFCKDALPTWLEELRRWLDEQKN